MCKYEHELCKHDLRGLTKHEVNQHYFEFIRNATKEEREANGFGRGGIGVYKCKICGDVIFCRKEEFKKYLKVCKNNCNGIRRSGSTVVIGYNDLATTHPDLIKYFVNIEDAYTHTYSSNKKVEMKCPICGTTKVMRIGTIIRQGFGCTKCGDGTSYPEKVLALWLDSLNIRFKKQLRFDGYKFLYDFYLIDYDIIIEVHGGQHYNIRRQFSWKSYEKEHENDLIKYDIAVLNGYEYNKNYFIIDARESNIEWLRNGISNCLFFKQFDLSDIDWKEIDKQAQNSKKVEACLYWKEQKEIDKDLTTSVMSGMFKVDRVTIKNWLKWGNKNGLCTYDEEKEREDRKRRHSKFVYLIKPDGTKWFDEPMSQAHLARETEISLKTIQRYTISGKLLEYNGNVKYSHQYVGSYIIEAK